MNNHPWAFGRAGFLVCVLSHASHRERVHLTGPISLHRFQHTFLFFHLLQVILSYQGDTFGRLIHLLLLHLNFKILLPLAEGSLLRAVQSTGAVHGHLQEPHWHCPQSNRAKQPPTHALHLPTPATRSTPSTALPCASALRSGLHIHSPSSPNPPRGPILLPAPATRTHLRGSFGILCAGLTRQFLRINRNGHILKRKFSTTAPALQPMPLKQRQSRTVADGLLHKTVPQLTQDNATLGLAIMNNKDLH